LSARQFAQSSDARFEGGLQPGFSNAVPEQQKALGRRKTQPRASLPFIPSAVARNERAVKRLIKSMLKSLRPFRRERVQENYDRCKKNRQMSGA
jgi:hypothetical protein